MEVHTAGRYNCVKGTMHGHLLGVCVHEEGGGQTPLQIRMGVPLASKTSPGEGLNVE